MPLDIEKYRHYLAEFDLSPEEQAELIGNVWAVLESFVDQAHGRNPHQLTPRDIEFKDLQDPPVLLESQFSHPLDKSQSFNHDPRKQ